MLLRSLASTAVGEMSTAVRRIRLVVLFYATAALLALMAAGFFIAAGYIAASARWGSMGAALVLGAAFAALSLVVVLTLKIWTRMRMRRLHQRRKVEADMIAGSAALALLSAFLARPIGIRSLALPFIALAGYAIYRENSKPDDE